MNKYTNISKEYIHKQILIPTQTQTHKQKGSNCMKQAKSQENDI